MIALNGTKPQITTAKIGGITLYRWNDSFGNADGSKQVGRHYLAVMPKVERPMGIFEALMEPEYVKETRTTRGTVEIVGAKSEGGRVDAFYKPARGFITGGIRYKLSAVREARALFHIIENGKKAEEPLAIYFDSDGNQALITKKVDGTVLSKANVSFEEKLDIFSREHMALEIKGIFPIDMSFPNIMVDAAGDAVSIDAEAYLVPGNKKIERDIERTGLIAKLGKALGEFWKGVKHRKSAPPQDG